MTRRYTGGFLSAKEQTPDSNTANGVFSLADAQQYTAAGNFPTGRWTPSRSIRFRRSNSAYMGTTPSVAGRRTTWTWSGWIKRGDSRTGNAHMLFTSGTTPSNDCCLFFETTGSITWFNRGGFTLATGALYRDPTAWYHIHCVLDTTNVTASERARIYVNGQRVANFTTATYPTLTESPVLNNANQAMYLGTRSDGYYFDGCTFDNASSGDSAST